MPTASPFLPSVDQTAYSYPASLDETTYFSIEGSKEPTTTQADHEIVLDRPTRFMNLRMYVTARPDFGETVKIALIVNGAATTPELSLTITSSTGLNAWHGDLADIVSAVAGDKVCFKVTVTGSTPTAMIQTVTMTRETS